jgi:hypothetical protein
MSNFNKEFVRCMAESGVLITLKPLAELDKLYPCSTIFGSIGRVNVWIEPGPGNEYWFNCATMDLSLTLRSLHTTLNKSYRDEILRLL